MKTMLVTPSDSPQTGYFQVSDEVFNQPPQTLLSWIEDVAAQEIILDLHLLNQVNHQILIALVRIYKAAQSLGKTLRLASVSAELRLALEISRLDQVLDCQG